MKIATLEILKKIGVDDYYYLFNYLKANEESDEWILNLNTLEEFTGYSRAEIKNVLEYFKYKSTFDIENKFIVTPFNYKFLGENFVFVEIGDDSLFGYPHSDYEGDDFEFKN